MNDVKSRHTQRGVALVVGLIMLVLITLVVTTAFTLSNLNFRAVGNMQFRDEAIAAANQAIENILVTQFTTNPTYYPNQAVDIDQDGVTDYLVDVGGPLPGNAQAQFSGPLPTPQCVQAVPVTSTDINKNGEHSNITNQTDYNTVWDIEARVTSTATGATVVIRQGIRQRLTQTQYNVLHNQSPSLC
jgi:uncharacterized protein (UPF0333 family)